MGYAKAIQAEIVAIALDNAIINTHKDSGRAAANWNLSIGTSPIPEQLDPSKYYQTGDKFGKIYGRGDGIGDDDITARKAKGSYYGYRANASCSENGYLYEVLGVKKKGGIKTVFIYNPVLTIGKYAGNARVSMEYLESPRPFSDATEGANRVLRKSGK